MPKLSILLPVYNAEKYLKDAIDSVLKQSFADFELLILNDGSTDGSVNVINSFNDGRIKIIQNDTNLKLIATLNKGLKIATGEYIVRMDADDICDLNRFQKQVVFLDQNIDYACVGSNYRTFGDADFGSDLMISDSEIRVEMLFQCPMAHPTTMFRRSLILEKNISYNPELIHIEDWGFWIELSKYGKLANLQEELLMYRITGDSISMQYRSSMESRYKFFYRIILKNIFGSLTEDSVDLHYQLATGNYKTGNSERLLDYRKKILKQLKENGYESKAIHKILKLKCLRLVFKISQESRLMGLKFAFMAGVVNFRVIRYIFGISILKRQKRKITSQE